MRTGGHPELLNGARSLLSHASKPDVCLQREVLHRGMNQSRAALLLWMIQYLDVVMCAHILVHSSGFLQIMGTTTSVVIPESETMCVLMFQSGQRARTHTSQKTRPRGADPCAKTKVV